MSVCVYTVTFALILTDVEIKRRDQSTSMDKTKCKANINGDDDLEE
jgi:hypothetical protein